MTGRIYQSVSKPKTTGSEISYQLRDIYFINRFEPYSLRGVLDTTLSDKACKWLETGR
jgi:hypothetical protein